jgi:hypothetical protein
MSSGRKIPTPNASPRGKSGESASLTPGETRHKERTMMSSVNTSNASRSRGARGPTRARRATLTVALVGAAIALLSSASGCGAPSDGAASDPTTTDEQALSSHTSWSAHKTCWLYPGGCAVDVQIQYQFYNGYRTILAYAFSSSCEVYRVDVDGNGDLHGEDGPSEVSYSPAVTHAVDRSLGLHSGRSQASLDLIIHSGSSLCEVGFGI